MLFKGYGAKVGLGNMRVKAENRMVTVIVEENDDSYVIDFQRGLGEVTYSKKDWTLTRALYHQSIQNYKKEIEEDLYEW